MGLQCAGMNIDSDTQQNFSATSFYEPYIDTRQSRGNFRSWRCDVSRNNALLHVIMCCINNNNNNNSNCYATSMQCFKTLYELVYIYIYIPSHFMENIILKGWKCYYRTESHINLHRNRRVVIIFYPVETIRVQSCGCAGTKNFWRMAKKLDFFSFFLSRPQSIILKSVNQNKKINRYLVEFRLIIPVLSWSMRCKNLNKILDTSALIYFNDWKISSILISFRTILKFKKFHEIHARFSG